MPSLYLWFGGSLIAVLLPGGLETQSHFWSFGKRGGKFRGRVDLSRALVPALIRSSKAKFAFVGGVSKTCPCPETLIPRGTIPYSAAIRASCLLATRSLLAFVFFQRKADTPSISMS